MQVFPSREHDPRVWRQTRFNSGDHKGRANCPIGMARTIWPVNLMSDGDDIRARWRRKPAWMRSALPLLRRCRAILRPASSKSMAACRPYERTPRLWQRSPSCSRTGLAVCRHGQDPRRCVSCASRVRRSNDASAALSKPAEGLKTVEADTEHRLRC
jgi:hypothetical protein